MDWNIALELFFFSLSIFLCNKSAKTEWWLLGVLSRSHMFSLVVEVTIQQVITGSHSLPLLIHGHICCYVHWGLLTRARYISIDVYPILFQLYPLLTKTHISYNYCKISKYLFVWQSVFMYEDIGNPCLCMSISYQRILSFVAKKNISFYSEENNFAICSKEHWFL